MQLQAFRIASKAHSALEKIVEAFPTATFVKLEAVVVEIEAVVVLVSLELDHLDLQEITFRRHNSLRFAVGELALLKSFPAAAAVIAEAFQSLITVSIVV